MHATAIHHHNPKITPAEARHGQLVTQTRKWVAQTFYGTVLKQMRNSPFKDKMFSGGRGGEAFGEMLDQKLAEHMTKSAGNKLVNSIVDRIEAAHSPKSGGHRVKRKHLSGVNSPRLNLKA